MGRNMCTGDVRLKMFILIPVLCNIINVCISVQVVRVSVPAYRVRGESAVLECEYELAGDRLYSVKWYRDNEEFYRYMPKFEPPQLSYKIEGVKVDEGASDARRVVLRPVTLKTRGVYRCEVSAEAPAFNSAHGEGRMEVLYFPKEPPRITGSNRIYQIGEDLDLNCTSGRSFPQTTLSWYIDDLKVTEPSYLVEYPVVQYPHGLFSTVVGLVAPVQQIMHLRCMASVILSSNGTSGDEAVYRDHRDALLLVRNSAMRLSTNGDISSSVISSLTTWFTMLMYIIHAMLSC